MLAVLVLTLCILVLLAGVFLFAVNIRRMLKGRCCGGCNGCRERHVCSVAKHSARRQP